MMQIELQLSRLRLHGMRRSWQVLLEKCKSHDLPLSEGLKLLLQAEEQDRTDRRFDQLKKNAHFHYQASIEELRLESSRASIKD